MSNGEEPLRLATVGATDLERRLLDAAARERPSPALTQQMRVAIGLPIAGAAVGAAVTAHAATAAPIAAAPVAAKAVAAKMASAWIAAGVLTTSALGGLWWATRASAPTAAAVTPSAPRRDAPVFPGPEPVVAPAATTTREGHAHRALSLAPAERRHPGSSASRSDLGGEIALVDAARTALRTGAPGGALALLRRYRAAYPAGTFRPEAAALKIEALSANGQSDRAETLARQFLAHHPDSPLAPRVARFANDASP